MKPISYSHPASSVQLDELAVALMDGFGISAISAALAVSAIDLASCVEKVSDRHVEEVVVLISNALGTKPTYQDGVTYEWSGRSTIRMNRKKGLEFGVLSARVDMSRNGRPWVSHKFSNLSQMKAFAAWERTSVPYKSDEYSEDFREIWGEMKASLQEKLPGLLAESLVGFKGAGLDDYYGYHRFQYFCGRFYGLMSKMSKSDFETATDIWQEFLEKYDGILQLDTLDDDWATA